MGATWTSSHYLIVSHLLSTRREKAYRKSSRGRHLLQEGTQGQHRLFHRHRAWRNVPWGFPFAFGLRHGHTHFTLCTFLFLEIELLHREQTNHGPLLRGTTTMLPQPRCMTVATFLFLFFFFASCFFHYICLLHACSFPSLLLCLVHRCFWSSGLACTAPPRSLRERRAYACPQVRLSAG